MILTEVNEDYCGKRYSDCSMAEDGSMCASGICYKEVSTGSGVPPNSDSCEGHNFDGICDDGGDVRSSGGTGTWYTFCDCGTDASDCDYRSPSREECAPPPTKYCSS